MKQPGTFRDFWKRITGQQPQQVEVNNNTRVTSAPVGHGTTNVLSSNAVPVTPSPLPSSSGSRSDVEKKTGGTLLFSGVFLGLTGAVFTTMGKLNYDLHHRLEWTQLLGPVLLSVGAAFVLISVCKYRMLLTCRPCRHRDEEEEEEEEEEGLDFPGHSSLVFNGVNQSITFHGATVLQYVPPPYASTVTHEVNPANGFQPNGSADGVPINVPPEYYTVCSSDHPAAAFTADEGRSARIETGRRHSRVHEKREHPDDGTGSDDGFSPTCPPPSYEDIYPSLQTDTST